MSEPDHAGNAHPLRFDDIGCLLNAVRSDPPGIHPVWLYRYVGDGWLRADDAFLVRSDAIHTAMGSGIVALGAGPQAETLALAHDGTVLSWDELLGQ